MIAVAWSEAGEEHRLVCSVTSRVFCARWTAQRTRVSAEPSSLKRRQLHHTGGSVQLDAARRLVPDHEIRQRRPRTRQGPSRSGTPGLVAVPPQSEVQQTSPDVSSVRGQAAISKK
jgi:hypothetical protein